MFFFASFESADETDYADATLCFSDIDSSYLSVSSLISG